MKFNFINIENQVFGKLTVLRHSGNATNGSALWLCKCECGKEVNIQGTHLRSGYYASCGCSKKDAVHGYNRVGSRKPEYNSWDSMVQRCTNPNNTSFYKYGGRGVSVCERWLIFSDFIEDMGDKPSSTHSIDRIDNNGNYEPGNCRWATVKEQLRNKRTNRIIEYGGVKKCVADWSDYLGIRENTISTRLRRGWSVSRSLGFD